MNAEFNNNYFGDLKHVYFKSGIITTSRLLRKVHTNDVYTLLPKYMPPAEERSEL
jgi:hypothetical protein